MSKFRSAALELCTPTKTDAAYGMPNVMTPLDRSDVLGPVTTTSSAAEDLGETSATQDAAAIAAANGKSRMFASSRERVHIARRRAFVRSTPQRQPRPAGGAGAGMVTRR
jgi:hypothetical protein